MSNGARADFGRLFNTTRYGSNIRDRGLFSHSSTVRTRVTMMTSAKLTSVSNSVMPICPMRSPVASRFFAHRSSFEGLLKIKESIQPSEALTCHSTRNVIRMVY